MLEIANGISGKGLLERANLFDKENIFSLAFFLNVGDISNIEALVIRKACNLNVEIKKHLEPFLLRLKTNNKIRIWFSSTNSEDKCFLDFIIYLINKIGINSKIYLIDVALLNRTSFISFSENEIKNLFEIQQELSLKDQKKIGKEWQKLIEENTEVRILKNNKLISCSFRDIDQKILKLLSKYSEISIKQFVIKECFLSGLDAIYSFTFFNYRINELIKSNQIKVIAEQKSKNLLNEDEIIQIISIRK